ncbi:MAG: hypothetical protein AAF265_15090, partial [Pseudomonadota bacterium]
MHLLHDFLLKTHIAIGLVAVVAFWIPVLARKGGRYHVAAGKVFSWCMYAVAGSAFVMCVLVLVDPIGVTVPARNVNPDIAYSNAARMRTFASFLLMLSMLVLSSTRHGLLALQLKKDRSALSGATHRLLLATLALTSVVVGYYGVTGGHALLIVFAILGISGSSRMLRDSFRTEWTRGQMIFAHLQGLLSTGIGAYTAVFAFGGSRLLAQLLPGQLQVIPWVLPSVIGLIAIRRYKSR